MVTEAGSLFAAYDGIGITILPLIALLCRVTGLKPMLVLVPLLAVGAMAGVALCSGDPYGAPPRLTQLPHFHCTLYSALTASPPLTPRCAVLAVQARRCARLCWC